MEGCIVQTLKFVTMDEKKVLCAENSKKIDEMAELMTREEVEDYINYDYMETEVK